MERQLVKHGESTLMVSLPKKWADKHKLKKGDSVNISESPEKIIISPREIKKDSLETSVHISKTDYEEVREILGGLYRKGYEKIIVRYDDPQCMYLIQLIVKSIQGFEIIEQREKSCVIKNISKELTIDINEILNKIINMIKSEFILVRDYLSKGVKGRDYEVRMLRDECWKYRNIAYAKLRDNLLSFSFDSYFKVHLFEHTATLLYWVYRAFDKSNINKASPEFLKLYDEIARYFDESTTKMKKGDSDYIDYVMTNRDKLLKECEDYTLEKQRDRILVTYLSMLVDNIHNPKSILV